MPHEVAPTFEAVADGFYLEGLLVDGDDIWFTDIGAGGVRRVGSDETLLPTRTMIGGLAINDDGALLVGGAGGISWVAPGGDHSGTLIEGLDGVNEMRADALGGLVFGTIDLPAILLGRRPGPSTIRRLSRGGEPTTLIDGLSFSNGMEISAEGETLYVNESFSATRAFALAPDGSVCGRRTLVDMPDCDGMTLDAEGNVWITGFASGEIRCVAPDGSEVGRLKLPGRASTNVRFGGADRRDLYVTIVDPAAAQTLAEGRPLTERTSTLFRTRSPVPGATPASSRFDLRQL